MHRPFTRARFRLTHALWACALALALCGVATLAATRPVGHAGAGYATARWVGIDALSGFSEVLSGWRCEPPELFQTADAPPARLAAGMNHLLPRQTPLAAALWPLPPPASAA